MKTTKIKITPRDKKDAQDVKNTKLLEELLNQEYEKYEGVISALMRIKILMPVLYGDEVKVPENMINNVLEELLKLEINENN